MNTVDRESLLKALEDSTTLSQMFDSIEGLDPPLTDQELLRIAVVVRARIARDQEGYIAVVREQSATRRMHVESAVIRPGVPISDDQVKR